MTSLNDDVFQARVHAQLGRILAEKRMRGLAGGRRNVHARLPPRPARLMSHMPYRRRGASLSSAYISSGSGRRPVARRRRGGMVAGMPHRGGMMAGARRSSVKRRVGRPRGGAGNVWIKFRSEYLRRKPGSRMPEVSAAYRRVMGGRLLTPKKKKSAVKRRRGGSAFLGIPAQDMAVLYKRIIDRHDPYKDTLVTR